MHTLFVLFYGFNMTQYTKMDIRNTITMSQVKNLILQSFGMSETGYFCKCEGGAFILKSKIRGMWMPPGMLTFQR